MNTKKTLNLIFKPTYQCNLQCRYCYADNAKKCGNEIMDYQEAQKCFDWVVDYCKFMGIQSIHIIWHGGEPLLSGPDFMKKTIEYYTKLCEQNDIDCKNLIQTNLTLLTKKYIPLIREYFNSEIGFSYDYCTGARLYKNGSDAAPAILKKAIWAQENDLQMFCISQFTNENSDKMFEMYEFFKKLDFPFKINRVFPSIIDNKGNTICDYTVSHEEYSNAMCKLFDIWLDDPCPTIVVKNLLDISVSLLRNKPHLCSYMSNCQEKFLCLGPGGDILPCGRFDPAQHNIGNYHLISPTQFLSARSEYLVSLEPIRAECSICEYYNICHGGCLHDRIIGWDKEDCLANKKIWKHIETRLESYQLKRGILANLSEDDVSDIINKCRTTNI